jgi:predicted Zn-dependent peptidase
MYLGNETSDDFADFVAFREIFGFPIKTLKDVEAEIRAVTAEQVQEAARAIYKTEKLNLGITGQGLNEEELKKLLAFS